MRTLPELFNEAYNDIASCGIPVAPKNKIFVLYNQKIGRNWGYCEHNTIAGYDYTIKLSKTLCQFTSENGILNTMIHELVHAAGAYGHKATFKKYAAIINKKFPGKYHVSRCTSAQEKMDDEQMNKAYKYLVACPKCNHTWGYNRMTMVVLHPGIYSCNKCNHENMKHGDKTKVNLVRVK